MLWFTSPEYTVSTFCSPDRDDVRRTSPRKNVHTCWALVLNFHLFIWFYRLSLKVHLHHNRHLKRGSLIAIQLLTSAPVTFCWRCIAESSWQNGSELQERCAGKKKNWGFFFFDNHPHVYIRAVVYAQTVAHLQTRVFFVVSIALMNETWFITVVSRRWTALWCTAIIFQW